MDPLSAIGAGASILGNLFSNRATTRANRQSQEFAVRRYGVERRDRFTDWERENEYNNPTSQMKRLQEAGLNPALMYAGSSGAASGQAGSINTPDTQSAQFREADFDKAGGAISDYFDVQIKQAQVENLRTQNTVIKQEAWLKEQQRYKTEVERKRGYFDLDFETELRQTSGDYRREQVRHKGAQADKVLNDDERAAAMTSASLIESLERVLNHQKSRAKTDREIERINQQIEVLKHDVRIREMDRELREIGVNPSDPWYMRVVGHLYNDMKRGEAGLILPEPSYLRELKEKVPKLKG